MPAGTIALTINSKTVTGSGTAFTTELKVNDFVVVVVGGVTYTLGVASIASNTSLTLNTAFGGPTTSGLAWTAVPNQTMVGITAQIAADTARAIRGLNYDKDNWQKIYSGSGTITVTLPDGSTFSGPSWNSITSLLSGKANQSDLNTTNNNVANKAAKGANGDITSLAGLTTALSIAQGGTGATSAPTALSALGGAPKAAPVFTGNGSIAGSFTTGAASGVAVAPVSADVANKVEINNRTAASANGAYMGWTALYYYSEYVLAGIRRGVSTSIYSYAINFNGASTFEMLATGNATAPGSWTNGSDERHKSNIKTVGSALSSVLSWRGVTYEKKDGGAEVGLIAQDVEKACKEAVFTTGNRRFSDDTVIPDFKYLNTAGAAAAFHTEAIKELFKLVELAIDNPEAAKSLIAESRVGAERISLNVIKNEDPWIESKPEDDPWD